jgi:hypothetical protein
MERQTALRLFAFPYLLNLFFYRPLAAATQKSAAAEEASVR